jgi:DNA-binding response OmpR family regulator
MTDDTQRRLLLAEDEENSSDGFVVECMKRNMVVRLARSYEQAAAILNEGSLDAVVLDLMLPRGDAVAPLGPGGKREHNGVVLLEEIRSGAYEGKGVAHDIPVFVLSAVADMGVKAVAFGLGVQDYFVKPEELAIVAERIKLAFQGDAP